MISPANLESLSKFDPAPLLVTSLYLPTDPKRTSRPALQTLLRDLCRERLNELKGAHLTHDQIKSFESDLERFQDFLKTHPLDRTGIRGLAAFSCAGRDFFETSGLPHGFKATLLAGPSPYLRPLHALLSQSPRAVTVLVDQHRFRGFAVHGNECQQLFESSADTGSRIKRGGLGGQDERHIEHHHSELVHHHYQDAADKLLTLFKSAPFDHLVLAGHLDELRGFERHLHSYLAERVAGRFRADVKSATRDDVRDRTLEIVRAEQKNRETDATQRLVGASRTNGGLAVIGLKSTLAALNDRRIQTLFVTEDLTAPGRRCPACETLFLDDKTCGRCGSPTAEATDIVDDALALAVHHGGNIRILPTDSPLAAHGRAGAMLRY